MIDNISVSVPAAPVAVVPVAVVPALPEGSATASSSPVQPGYCGVPRCRKYLSDASAPCPACTQEQKVAEEAAQRLEAKRLHEVARQEQLAMYAPKHALRCWQGLSAGFIVLSLFLIVCCAILLVSPHPQKHRLASYVAASTAPGSRGLQPADSLTRVPSAHTIYMVSGTRTANDAGDANGPYVKAGSYSKFFYYQKGSWFLWNDGASWHIGKNLGSNAFWNDNIGAATPRQRGWVASGNIDAYYAPTVTRWNRSN